MDRPQDDHRFDIDAITTQLSGSAVGHTVRYVDSVPSTMPIAREEAERPTCRSGYVVVAEEQTYGRGRYDRRWDAPHGQALLMTVVLKPPYVAQPLSRMAMLAGVAVVEAIAEQTPALSDRIRLKWPNDVLIKDGADAGKVAGILVETSLIGTDIAYALLGIGVNVNQSASQLAAVSAPGIRPVSLAAAIGKPLDRQTLLIAVCRWMSAYLAGGSTVYSDGIFGRWRELLDTIGRLVTVATAAGHETLGGLQWRGKAIDVDPDGNLIVRLPDGEERTFSAGDVTLHE